MSTTEPLREASANSTRINTVTETQTYHPLLQLRELAGAGVRTDAATSEPRIRLPVDALLSVGLARAVAARRAGGAATRVMATTTTTTTSMTTTTSSLPANGLGFEVLSFIPDSINFTAARAACGRLC